MGNTRNGKNAKWKRKQKVKKNVKHENEGEFN